MFSVCARNHEVGTVATKMPRDATKMLRDATKQTDRVNMSLFDGTMNLAKNVFNLFLPYHLGHCFGNNKVEEQKYSVHISPADSPHHQL